MKISKTGLILLLIVALTLILRIIAANNVEMKPDEMIYSVNSININQANVLSTVQQGTLYSHFTDIWFELFGPTAITARLTSILFAALAVVMLYLIGRDHLNSKKIGLFTAFFFSISAFAIKYNIEMDMMGFGLAFISIYFFFQYLKEHQARDLYITALFFTLAFLTRNVVLLMIPAFVILLIQNIYKNKNQKEEFEKTGKRLGIAILIAIATLTPLIAYNYLTYTYKGITDYYVSDFLGIGQNALANFQNKMWDTDNLIHIWHSRGIEFISIDFILLTFAIIGTIYSIKKKQHLEIIQFGILAVLPYLIYLAGVTGSPTHYLIIPLILSIIAGIGANWLFSLLNHKTYQKILTILLLITITIATVVLLRHSLTENSSVLGLREYVHQNVEDNALIIPDPRVYLGIHAWAFGRKYFLTTDDFIKAYPQFAKSQDKITIPFYYVECGNETTCAWSKEDYDSVAKISEEFSAKITPNLHQVAEISGNEEKPGARHHFIIYKGQIQVPPSIYETISKRNNFWGYSLAWRAKEINIDYYKPEGINVLIHYIGMLVLYIELLFVLIIMGYILYLPFTKKIEDEKKPAQHHQETYSEHEHHNKKHHEQHTTNEPKIKEIEEHNIKEQNE